MLDDTVKRLKEKVARSHVSCLDCWYFDHRELDIINYEGEKVRVMRGCTNYRDCHRAGYKAFWSPR